MLRKLGLGLGVVALLAIGFFLKETGQLIGIIETPAATPAGAPGGMPGGNPAGSGYPGGAAGESNLVPVEVAPAVVRSIRERVSGSGILEPAREVTLLARVEGEVQSLLVEEGQIVETGAELCVIDEELLSISASIARIERDQAKRNHERLAELVDSRSVSPQELEDAKFAADRAAAGYDQAAFNLSHARPGSPFAGTIVERHIEMGQSVRSGDALFTIADFDPLRVRIRLPESAVHPIVPEQAAELRSSRDGPLLIRGRVERVSPVVDRESLTVEVVVRFDFVPGQVRPGSFAHVDIITRTEEDVVLVPRRAVLREDGQPYLFRAYDGRAHRVDLIVGYEDEAVVQVREGIEAGDRVVTEGMRELRDGSPVSIYREVPIELDPLTIDGAGGGRG